MAESHDCQTGEIPVPCEDLSRYLSCKWYADLCKGVSHVYADGSASKDERGVVVAGARIYRRPESLAPTQSLKLGEKTSQYAELVAAFVAMKQAVDLGLSEVVVCTDSNYVCNVFSTS